MTVTSTEQGDAHEEPATTLHGDDAGHHETPLHRDHKERIALWLFIGGDALFLILELFTWFYLRTLNTNGLWIGAQCTTAHPCTDGLGNPITHEITKANPWYSVGVAALAVLAALLILGAETASRQVRGRRAITTYAGLAMVVLLGAVALGFYQFQVMPFTTIDGAYASSYLFFMGSTLAHLILLTFIGIGLWNRSRLGRYDDGLWFRVRITRLFAVWIATSAVILMLVSTFFA